MKNVDFHYKESKPEVIYFSKDLSTDISIHHKLQIKKSGELISFYFDDQLLFRTKEFRIESKEVKLFVGYESDFLVDYLVWYY